MASVAAARRTQSSFSAYLKSTNPSDLTISAFGVGPGSGAGQQKSFTDTVAHLPHVRHLATLIGLDAIALGPDGNPSPHTDNVIPAGSADGLFSRQDRVTVIRGRAADPNRSDEFVASREAASELGLHVGQVMPIAFYIDAQTNAPDFSAQTVAPKIRLGVRLVGIIESSNDVVQDDVDRLPGLMVFTPAISRQLVAGSTVATYNLQLDHGGRDAAAVEQAFLRVLPAGSTYNFHLTSRAHGAVERAVRPESIALGGFGLITGLVALFIAAQAIIRQVRAGDAEVQVLRAIGAGPSTTVADGLTGVLGAVVLGAMLAVGVAIALSPIAPLGPVRAVYPTPGIAADWTVLGLGLLVLIVVLGVVAVAIAYRAAPHRAARTSAVAPERRSSAARLAAASGLPEPGVVGIRFALDRGRGPAAAPVRSALLGTTLAVVMMVATLTFGASLHALVSRPALYGWNWSYILDPSNKVPTNAVAMLNHDPAVSAWTGVTVANAQIDGQNIPILLQQAGAQPQPPILSGHELEADDQTVLGAETLKRLHKRIGDSVVVTYGTPEAAPVYVPPTTLHIVGTATMPAIGFSSITGDHPSMGSGALIPVGIEPLAFREAQRSPDPLIDDGPGTALVRLRPGVTAAAGRADMQRIADAAIKALAADPNSGGSDVRVLPVERPAEIVNYRSVGATPAVLALGLAAGAVVGLALTLVASVRRRRRDLALLKTLGFRPRQLAATVAWQASVAAVIGIVLGVPLGIALGRQLWIIFAHSIHAVPHPAVPVPSVLLVAAGTLVLANLVAALPGRSAARTPAAMVMRTV
ncbi:MAG: hypothetical protein JWO37_1011 [Acidimicrobiales bacterium]|jgi:ABC-type lipoprotein release transport system permease subunit|nr:hypothetical protein [Acidimicrobiales bacterium]